MKRLPLPSIPALKVLAATGVVTAIDKTTNAWLRQRCPDDYVAAFVAALNSGNLRPTGGVTDFSLAFWAGARKFSSPNEPGCNQQEARSPKAILPRKRRVFLAK